VDKILFIYNKGNIMKAILLFAFLLPTFAHADDLYSERLRSKEEQEKQQAIQQIKTAYARATKDALQNIEAFGRAHSGYASEPRCGTMGSDVDGSSFWARDNEECNGSFCVTVRTEGGTSQYENNPESLNIVLAYNLIQSCRVVLNNGLACAISNDWESKTFGGNCLDAQGNSHRLTIPLKSK
jgi:hypothetical protein